MTKNAVVQQGLTGDSLVWAFTDLAQVGYWMPVTWLSHMLDVELFGLAGGAHHVASVVGHMLNAVLLFWALQALSFRLDPTRAFWVNAFIAAAFALHPLRVESVAWVAERKDVLSTGFWLASLLAWGHFVRSPGVARYALVALLLALGLMSKPMLVTLPVALLLLDHWPLQRFAPGDPHRRWRRLVLEKLPLLAIALMVAGLTLYAKQQLGTAIKSLDAFPWEVRVANALVAYAEYLRMLVVPIHLSAYYPHPGNGIAVWKVAGATALLAATSALAVWQRRTRPWLIVGWLWFLGTLFPVSGVVQTGSQAMADRFTSIPHIGLLWIVGWGGAEVLDRAGLRSRARAALAGAMLLALALTSARQTAHWRNSVTLFEHAVSLDDSNYLAHNNLGVAFRTLGRHADAERAFRKAIEANPDYPLPYLNMAQILDDTQRPDEALPYLAVAFRAGLRLQVPGALGEDAGGLHRAASRLSASEDPAQRRQSIRLYRLIVALHADAYLPDAHFQLGRLYLEQGDLDEARAQRDVLEALDPMRAEFLGEIESRNASQGEGR